MKIIIRENERGLLIRDGQAVEWLEPGPQRRWPWGAQLEVERVDLSKPVSTWRPELAELAPRAAWTELRVAPSQLAVMIVDGIAKAYLRPGRYMLWQLREEVTATVYDLDVLTPRIDERHLALLPSDLVQVLDVAPYQRVLVYADGALARVLEAGRTVLSRLDRSLRLLWIDLREEERTITGQEVMTADKVTLRLSVILKYRVVDAVRAVESVTDLGDALYSEAQMAARRAVAGLKLDALLEGRREVSEAMTAEVSARAAEWGVTLVAVDVKDLVLPGEMKVLLNKVIEAEKQAAAQVILRREETAATRSQANTAKMLEGNPTLMRLRELEAYKEIAASLDQVTLVAGTGNLLERVLGNPAVTR